MTPRRWVIGVPCWGDHYINLARNVSLPCIKAARTALPIHMIIHTNQPGVLDEFQHDFTLEYRPIQHEGWHQYSMAHFEVCRIAMPEDFVSCLPVDAAISSDFFAFCEQCFKVGKKIVVAEGTRTLANGHYPPVGVSGQLLTDWSLKYLHPCMKECFWGSGRSTVHSSVYFADGDNVVKHCFHYGPMGFVKDTRAYVLGGDSTDGSFMDSFRRDEMYIARPHELAIIECSPITKQFGTRREYFTLDNVIEWAKSNSTLNHRFMFRHPVVLRGVDSGASRPIVEAILGAL